MKTKTHMWLARFLVLGIIVLSSPVYAVPIVLNNWNVAELNLDPVTDRDYVTVEIGSSGGHTTLTVQWHSGGVSGLTPVGIEKFGYNDSIGVNSLSGNTASWHFNFDGTQYDGFGDFASHHNEGSGENGGISAPLVFTLRLEDGGLADFTDPNEDLTFVAQVRYGNDCSGFVSNRTTTSIGSNANCGAPVPEPSSLLLVSSGLVGLGLWGRRRFKAKV